MKRSILHLGLSLLAVVGVVGVSAGRLLAQNVVPAATQIMVVPAVNYEPAHPGAAPAVPIPATTQRVGYLAPDDGSSAPPSSIQTVGYQMPMDPPGFAPSPDGPHVDVKPDNAIPVPGMWIRAEYLLWWVKNGPMPTPLVTTGNPSVGFPALNTAGAIGQPGTQILLGGSSLDYNPFSGGRLDVGGWLDSERTIGLDVTAFCLERRPYDFGVASDPTGNNPPIYLPRYNPSAGINDAVPIADPLRGFAGSVAFNSSLQLWGAEANLSWNLIRQPGLEFTLLGGFRYASLSESAQLNASTADLASGNITTLSDYFGTNNQFFGGQIGAQFVLERYGFSLDVTGKVAFGANQQVVDVNGSTTQYGPNPLTPPGLGTTAGGFFAEPSNIGHHTGDCYSVIPSVELNLSYQITPELRTFVGFTFMYWTNVVRPGDQISGNVNTTQNAVLSPTGAASLIGSPTPTPLFNRSDFFAYGFNVGFEFRF